MNAKNFDRDIILRVKNRTEFVRIFEEGRVQIPAKFEEFFETAGDGNQFSGSPSHMLV